MLDDIDNVYQSVLGAEGDIKIDNATIRLSSSLRDLGISAELQNATGANGRYCLLGPNDYNQAKINTGW